MKDSKERFSEKVDNYVKYRPSYPSTVIDYIIEKSGIGTKSVVADIGSGTGKFTKLLLDRNIEVFGIEPNDNMRKAAEDELSKYPDFHSINASAEATTLADASIDLITVAQAFHWFDREKCSGEFKRILKNDGKIALVWNSRDQKSEFMAAAQKVLKQYSVDSADFATDVMGDEVFLQFFESYEVVHFRQTQKFDLPSYLGRAASSSYSPQPDHENYLPQRKALTEIFEKYQQNDEVELVYKTELIIGKVGRNNES